MRQRTDKRLGVAITAGCFFAMLMSANLATPLYAGYSERFDFSTAVLALIFATYAIVLIPSLLLFGQVSDRFGRRPVIAVGLGVAMAGLGCFAVADGLAWLFAARALLGLAQGMVSGAATAALVEQVPEGEGRQAALFATLAQAGGSASGPLLAGFVAHCSVPTCRPRSAPTSPASASPPPRPGRSPRASSSR
jgi:MFS family permease